MSEHKLEIAGWFCSLLLITFQTGCSNSASRTSMNESAGLIINQPAAPALPLTQNAKPFAPAVERLPEPKQEAGMNCSLDAISWQPAPAAVVIDHGETVEFQGWTGDDTLGVPSKVMVILIGDGNAFAVEGRGEQSRPDVASARKNPAFLKSGYAIDASLREVPQGEYRLALIDQFGKIERYCDLGKTVAIK